MLSQIARAAPDLSRAEKRVASWVLDHPKQATSATLAHIANECGTSEPTVLRFCRRMGMKGFRELGVRVAESLSVPGSYVHRDVNPDDSISDAAIKVMDASIQSLAEMRAQLSSMPIDAAATAMAAARQIAFAGLGASGHVARDACHKFFRLGIPCSSLLDTPMILQFAAIAEPDDVLVLRRHERIHTDEFPARSVGIAGCVVSSTCPHAWQRRYRTTAAEQGRPAAARP